MKTTNSPAQAQNGHLIGLKFEGKQIQVIERDGDTWWLTIELAALLGLQNIRQLVSGLDSDQVSVQEIYGNAGRRKATIVNESGLYELIFRSDKPEAKRFRKWVTSEVLPKIRKTGTYSTVSTDPMMRLAAINSEIAAMMGMHQERIDRLESHMRPGDDWMSITGWLHEKGIEGLSLQRKARLSAYCIHASGKKAYPVGAEKYCAKSGAGGERKTFSPEILDEICPKNIERWKSQDAMKAAMEGRAQS